MSNIRHLTMRPIESKNSDPTNKANRIEFATFDPTECTRLVKFVINDLKNLEVQSSTKIARFPKYYASHIGSAVLNFKNPKPNS